MALKLSPGISTTNKSGGSGGEFEMEKDQSGSEVGNINRGAGGAKKLSAKQQALTFWVVINGRKLPWDFFFYFLP